jgi:signal transduction histidine kinase
MQRLLESLQQAQKRALHPLVLHRADIQLDRVIRATLANYDALAAQCHITLSVELPPALPLVNADQDRVIQVLTNLLDNALKFTPAGGSITIRAGQVNKETWVTVADTGSGVAPEELPSLFQEFYQGGNMHDAEKRGMGLGLTLSREILRAHGGTIRVESEPGSGTCVTFTLPKTKRN